MCKNCFQFWVFKSINSLVIASTASSSSMSELIVLSMSRVSFGSSFMASCYFVSHGILLNIQFIEHGESRINIQQSLEFENSYQRRQLWLNLSIKSRVLYGLRKFFSFHCLDYEVSTAVLLAFSVRVISSSLISKCLGINSLDLVLLTSN